MRALTIGVLLGALCSCVPAGPVATVSAPACVVVAQPFALDGSGSKEAGAPLQRWRWDLGDGSPALISTHPVQVHRYLKPGMHTVRLTVTDAEGREGSTTRDIEVQSGVRACGEVVPPPTRRLIHVDACAEEGIARCLVDFGPLEAGEAAVHELTITNPGTRDLRVDSIRVVGDSGDAFTVDQPVSLQVIAQDEAGIRVRLHFTPAPGTLHAAMLHIRSNAENLPQDEDTVRVRLTGRALDAPFPRFEIEPLRCDFGAVPVMSSGDCRLRVRNSGTASVLISALDIPPDPPGFVLATVRMLPWELLPDETGEMLVEFRPQQAGAQQSTLQIQTNDPIAEEVLVPLAGVGVELEPQAVPRVESVNGAPPPANGLLRPLDDVVVTGADSVAGRVGRPIVSYRWELLSRPDESTVVLSSPGQVRTGFEFNSSGMQRAGLDVVGEYVVRLTVTDSAGQQNINDGRLTLRATPGLGLHVQLTWEEATSDVDLHVLRTPGLDAAFGQDDCYYANCAGNSDLNWGGGDRNPHLDVDDTDGFGPENTRINDPEPNRTYEIGVHLYGQGSASGPIPARVKIFLGGLLLGEFQQPLERCNAYWRVATVMPGAASPLSVLGTVTQVNHAGCFN